MIYCQVHGAQRTEMPTEEDKWLKFTDISKQLKVPFVVYADFESILERHYGCQPDPNKSSTIKLAKHVPSGFTYKVVGVSPETTENHVTYRGEDAVEKFMDHMVKLKEKLVSILRNPKPMNLSDQESESFLKATHCCICKDQLGNDTVRDHCHVTGKFRGAAHSSCNLNLRLRERIPVFFHNLKGFDAHHIMSVIGKYKHKRINCIPQNHEKYIAFLLGNLDFVDTFQFMSTSLEKLSINLAKEGLHKFPHLEAYVTSTLELELLTDPDMHLFIDKGLRGGIAMISKRYAKANNPYLNDYDPQRSSNYLMYLDANNLYGWAMCQPLPTHAFDWLSSDCMKSLQVNSIPFEGDTGYIFEVDMEYPKELHDGHNDYPLAPESFKIEQDMLSPYQKELLTRLGMKEGYYTKLMPNLFDKEKYVLHYRNLQLYLSLGMKLTKVHRVLSFKQSPWLKAYIDFNTTMRKTAKNEFEKDFFKLMNNIVFGKTMENLRKRVDIQLVHNKKRLLKLSAKPGFKSFQIFNNDLASVELSKQKLILNRPIYVGFSILDLSKVLMYDFHYNYIKKRYEDCASLCFTDTDSLCYDISTADLYEDMKQDQRNSQKS